MIYGLLEALHEASILHTEVYLVERNIGMFAKVFYRLMSKKQGRCSWHFNLADSACCGHNWRKLHSLCSEYTSRRGHIGKNIASCSDEASSCLHSLCCWRGCNGRHEEPTVTVCSSCCEHTSSRVESSSCLHSLCCWCGCHKRCLVGSFGCCGDSKEEGCWKWKSHHTFSKKLATENCSQGRQQER